MAKQFRYLMGLALLFATTSSFAQATYSIRFKVPFPFTAAGKSWAPGNYRVQVNAFTNLLTLTSVDINDSMTMVIGIKNQTDIEKSYMRFRTDGEHLVLSEVLAGGQARTISLTKSERNLLKAHHLKSQEPHVASVSADKN